MSETANEPASDPLDFLVEDYGAEAVAAAFDAYGESFGVDNLRAALERVLVVEGEHKVFGLGRNLNGDSPWYALREVNRDDGLGWVDTCCVSCHGGKTWVWL